MIDIADRRTKARMKRVLAVIKKFKPLENVYLIRKDNLTIEKGKPTYKEKKIAFNLIVMNANQRYMMYQTTINNRSVYDLKHECYYIFDNEEIKGILENDVIEIQNVKYRVNKVESNYNIFERLELIRNDNK